MSANETEAVRAELLRAIEQRQRVSVVVRADLEAGRTERVLEGTPINLERARSGAERVTLEVSEGETLQKVLLDRIERVLVGAP